MVRFHDQGETGEERLAERSGAPVRVAVVDDDSLLVAALGMLFADEPSLRFVGGASTVDAGVRLVAEAQPDVAVVDVRMPAGGGTAVAEAARQAAPRTVVVALSASDDPLARQEMAAAGATRFLTKTVPLPTLLEVVDELGRKGRRAPAQAGHQPAGTRFRFSGSVEELAVMRAELGRALLAAGWPAERVADMLLVADELATNAIVHAGTGFDVRCVVDGEATLEVADWEPGELPHLVPGDQPRGEHRGFGLQIVDELSREWSVEVRGRTKVVRAVFDHDAAESAAPPPVTPAAAATGSRPPRPTAPRP